MDAYETEQVGRYRVELHHDNEEWHNIARDADNIGRVSIPHDPDSRGHIDWDWQDDAYTYQEAREHAGEPILAIPLSIWTQSYTIVRPRLGSWDGADGFYWAPISAADEWQGHADDPVAALKARMLAEVQELASELEGDVWGYIVFGPDGQQVESCWGFIGQQDYAMSEGVRVAEWANLRDAINWAALPNWVRQTVLIREAGTVAQCVHCDRQVVMDEDGRWVDPEATGDDAVWYETCDSHGTFTAEHEPSYA